MSSEPGPSPGPCPACGTGSRGKPEAGRHAPRSRLERDSLGTYAPVDGAYPTRTFLTVGQLNCSKFLKHPIVFLSVC